MKVSIDTLLLLRELGDNSTTELIFGWPYKGDPMSYNGILKFRIKL